VFFALNSVSGFKRSFSVDDVTSVFAEHERVPDWALYIIAFVAPLTLTWGINALTVRSWWDAHASALGPVVLSLALAGSITQFTKITVGRPRPDLLDRCQMASSTVDPPFGLSTVAICNQPDTAKLEDGFRSFPSGHSSLSFAGLGFLAFYLAGKVHLFDGRGHAPKAWLALTPLAGAALVAISRTMDYRHHWQDVLVGSLLGFVIAYFSYRHYYPSLASPHAHFPHPPRTEPPPQQPLLPVHTRASAAYGVPYSDLDGADAITEDGAELAVDGRARG
ncbi:phosphatidic acid phosphatase type 2/haloperoxidase, partial [Vararia minispora EC-137]